MKGKKMKGFKQYEKFKKGGSLTPGQAILAHCYVCNGESEGGEDCSGVSCPLYQYMPYRKSRQRKEKKDLSLEQKAIMVERMKKAREHRVNAPDNRVL
jgi:hypothetical protein